MSIQDTVTLKLSCVQDSRVGKLLHKLYYNDSALLKLVDNVVGYPHNGGQHTCVLTDSRSNILAFLELVNEHFLGDHQQIIAYLYQDIISDKLTKHFNVNTYRHLNEQEKVV